MHRVQVETGHLFEEVRCGRAGRDCYVDNLRESFGFFGVAEEGVDCRGGVEVCDVFLFQQSPNFGVIDLA